ncbi:hypothetical protein [uncultured Megasphaera sp.]|uniref:hyaluronate lyase N-terminal domain-containing protein n=1 Tax=uncultured Megasphaera sp. TaxID=165188 RepID=UPI0025FF4397|nr:hypothetical protein [uncultured Megasphaera sp.]
MSEQTLKVKTLYLRNDTAATWVEKNPVLAKGEPGVEVDTGKFKLGDGVTSWVGLRYAGVLVSASEQNGYIKIDGVDTLVYRLPIGGASIGGVKTAAGTGKVSIAADGTMSVSNVASADKLSASRTIAIAGDATGSATFDGSAGTSITVALVASGVKAGTYSKVTVDAKGRVTAGSNLTTTDISGIGTAAGNIPILGSDGKLSDSVIPAIAISESHTVASEHEMLALAAQVGDIAIRTDGAGTWILKQTPASTLANWVQLKSPTDAATSVNGKTGNVILTTSDIAEGTNQYYTQARFVAAFKASKSTDLSDSANLIRNSDTLILDCGNA